MKTVFAHIWCLCGVIKLTTRPAELNIDVMKPGGHYTSFFLIHPFILYLLSFSTVFYIIIYGLFCIAYLLDVPALLVLLFAFNKQASKIIFTWNCFTYLLSYLSYYITHSTLEYPKLLSAAPQVVPDQSALMFVYMGSNWNNLKTSGVNSCHRCRTKISTNCHFILCAILEHPHIWRGGWIDLKASSRLSHSNYCRSVFRYQL